MKTIMKFFLSFLVASSLSAQITDPRDFVVLLDLGPALTAHRNSVVSVFLNVILKDYLNSSRLDEFHLIGFAKVPRLMFRETSFSRERVESFLVDLYRLPESDEQMDLISGLDLAKDYLRSLATAKTKQVVLIMDGKSPGGEAAVLWKKNLIDFHQYLRANKWRFRLVLLPYDGSQPELDLSQIWKDEIPLTILNDSEDFANKLLGSPRIFWPEASLKIGRSFRLPLKVINYEQENLLLRVRQILIDGQNALNRPFSLSLPPNSNRSFDPELSWNNAPEADGEYSMTIEVVFEDGNRAFPNKRILKVNYSSSTGSILDIRLILIIFGIILVGVLVIWLVIKLLNYQATGHRLDKVQAARRLGKLQTSIRSLDRGYPQESRDKPAQAEKGGPLTASDKDRSPARVTPRTASQSTQSFSVPRAQPQTQEGRKTTLPHQESFVSYSGSSVTGPKEEELARFGNKQPTWESRDSYAVNEPGTKKDCTFVVEIWTDDYMFQNNIGKRGRFYFQVGDKKVLGAPTGIPVRILRTPELGELTWDGDKLWFRPLVENLNTGKEPIDVINREIVWSPPGKMGLHVVLQPYVSEAEKFKRFLRNLGKTNPDI